MVSRGKKKRTLPAQKVKSSRKKAPKLGVCSRKRGESFSNKERKARKGGAWKKVGVNQLVLRNLEGKGEGGA